MQMHSVYIGRVETNSYRPAKSNASSIPPPPPQSPGQDEAQKAKPSKIPLVILGLALIAVIVISGAILYNYSNALAAKDAQITSLNSQITGLNGQIASLQSEAAAKTAQIASLQAEVSALQSNLTGALFELSEKQAQIVDLQQQIADLDDDIDALQAQLDECEQQLAAMGDIVEENEQLKQVKLNAVNLVWAWSEVGWTHSVRITGTIFNSGVYSAINTTMHIYIYDSLGETIRIDEIALGDLLSMGYVNVDHYTIYSGYHATYEYNFTFVQEQP